MKKIILIFTLILFAVCLKAQTGWYVQPAFTSQNLYDSKGSGTGNLSLASDNGKIFRSSNGGFNWWEHNFNDPLLNGSAMKFIYGQSNDNFTAVGQGSAFAFKYETIDSVMRIPVFPQKNLEAYTILTGVFFYQALIAAGQDGNFYYKEDTLWKKNITATNLANGRNINYCKNNIFVGDNGLIIVADSIGLLRSNGERIRWRIIASGTTKNLNCISGGGGSSIFMAVGNDGIILRTTDNGETWSNISSPVTEDLNSIWLGSAKLICGANGTILKSFDANQQIWHQQISPTVKDLYFINSLGYFEYIAGGKDGMFIRTEDGGGELKTLYLTALIEAFYNSTTDVTIQDTVKVNIRSSVSPYNIAASSKEISNINGLYVYYLSPILQNSVPYYIQLKHRNSIETWSNTTQSFSSDYLLYDFTNASNKAYGNNQKKIDNSPVRYGIYSGDVNQDGAIDISDASLVDNDASNFVSGYVNSDVNGDGIVDLTDGVVTDNNASNFVSKITP